jgi:hypothetical protein
MENTKPYVNPNYLFKWEPEKKILFFITQGAHVSGTALKNLEYIQPLIIEQLKRYVDGLKPAIGSVIPVQDNYIFIVSRKHYSSKHDLDLVRKALMKLQGIIKMSNEDFPDIVKLVSTEFTNIELKTTSNWDNSRL